MHMNVPYIFFVPAFILNDYGPIYITYLAKQIIILIVCFHNYSNGKQIDFILSENNYLSLHSKKLLFSIILINFRNSIPAAPFQNELTILLVH